MAAAKRKMLNTKQASEYLGGMPSACTLERWRKITGKGPLWQDRDGLICYDPDDLDAYVQKSLQVPGEERSA